MIKKLIIFIMLPIVANAQSVEECQQTAERNYPLIKQYDLTSRTTDLTIESIDKGWLPQVSASAQVSIQNSVTAFPDELQQLYRQMGIGMKGLRKDQYRIGIDVQQTVYDGGNMRMQKEIARQQGNIESVQTEVNMYNVRKRVNDMFFALLLVDEKIAMNNDLTELLKSNEKKLLAMVKGGTAAESDYQSMKAERLSVEQRSTTLKSQRNSLQQMLSTFCGMEIVKPTKPDLRTLTFALQTINRPELKVIDEQQKMADIQEKELNSRLKPVVSVFAQGYYGYPGNNLFEDMINRRWSLNGMIGIRLTWNIGSLYTHNNDKAKLQLQRQQAENSRDVFLFNSNIEQIQQREDIKQHLNLIANDEEIILLRGNIRKAAESKLLHGIIDVNDLLKDINAENNAKVQHSIHEIELLKAIYDLKYIINE